METKIDTENSCFCLTFELQEAKIDPVVLADFLNDFTCIYEKVVRFKELKMHHRDTYDNVPESLNSEIGLNNDLESKANVLLKQLGLPDLKSVKGRISPDVLESLIKVKREYSARRSKPAFEDLNFSEFDIKVGLDRFKEHLEQDKKTVRKAVAEESYLSLGLRIDEERWLSSMKAHFSPYHGQSLRLKYRSNPIEILRLSLNSPLKMTFGGASWALVIGILICGGEVDTKNGTAKMPGLVDSAIKLNEAFFSKQDRKEIIALIEQLEKESAKDKKQNQDYSDLGRRELLAVIEDLKRENELIKKQRGTPGPNETI